MLRKCTILKGITGLVLLMWMILLVNLDRFCGLGLRGGEGSKNLGRFFVHILLVSIYSFWKLLSLFFLIRQIILLVRFLLIILAPIFAAISSRRNRSIIQILISSFDCVARCLCRFWLQVCVLGCLKLRQDASNGSSPTHELSFGSMGQLGIQI